MLLDFTPLRKLILFISIFFGPHPAQTRIIYLVCTHQTCWRQTELTITLKQLLYRYLKSRIGRSLLSRGRLTEQPIISHLSLTAARLHSLASLSVDGFRSDQWRYLTSTGHPKCPLCWTSSFRVDPLSSFVWSVIIVWLSAGKFALFVVNVTSTVLAGATTPTWFASGPWLQSWMEPLWGLILVFLLWFLGHWDVGMAKEKTMGAHLWNWLMEPKDLTPKMYQLKPYQVCVLSLLM